MHAFWHSNRWPWYICRRRNIVHVPRTSLAVHRHAGVNWFFALAFGILHIVLCMCVCVWICMCVCVFAGTIVDFPDVSLTTCFPVKRSKIWAEENSLLATHLTVSKGELCVAGSTLGKCTFSAIKMKNTRTESFTISSSFQLWLKRTQGTQQV